MSYSSLSSERHCVGQSATTGVPLRHFGQGPIARCAPEKLFTSQTLDADGVELGWSESPMVNPAQFDTFPTFKRRSSSPAGADTTQRIWLNHEGSREAQ